MSSTVPTAAARAKRHEKVGVVVSNKMQKTIVVQVRRRVRHPLYNRVMTQATSFQAHDEANSAKIGDWVRIMETRPLSRHKRWRLVEILQRASTAPPVPGTEAEPQRAAPARSRAAAQEGASS